MSTKISIAFLFAAILFNLPLVSAADSAKPKYTKDSAKELLKKYGSYRPKEVLYLNDSMSSIDRVDLDNEYFKVSYSKCFIAELPDGDTEGLTVKTSAAINLKRSNKCKAFQANYEKDLLGLYLQLEYTDPEKIESFEPASSAVYRQSAEINGNAGVIVITIGKSEQLDSWNEPVLGWSVEIACKGKKNELFDFSSVLLRGEKIEDYLKKKKFDIPNDYKEIISTFHCRKDR